MLDLILIRHAHAGPHTQPDEARGLSARGIAEAKGLLNKPIFSLKRGVWLVSDARRTQETQALISNEIPLISYFWYNASGPAYVTELGKQSAAVIYLVAHNPSISYVASYFSGESIYMETADCVHLSWPTLDSWSEVTQGSATQML